MPKDISRGGCIGIIAIRCGIDEGTKKEEDNGRTTKKEKIAYG